MKTWICNGYVLDPATNTEGVRDILIEDGRICRMEASAGEEEKEGARQIDAKGCYVAPGLVDLHVHLREPGYEYKETVKTGTLAAAKGGFTSIFAMPNTKPVTDSKESVERLMAIVKEDAAVHVYPIGAVTYGQAGERATDASAMKEAGVRAISEDGKSVMDAGLYLRAMRSAREADVPVFAHCEDACLVDGGVMNAGAAAESLHLRGISNVVEDVIVARDILLAEEAGVRLHLCHCSTKGSVEWVRMAKGKGLPVTAEACPHHFTLSDEDIVEDDGNYKMNPPLRGKEDVKALKEALKEGVIEAIATDHAPHAREEKEGSIADAMFGVVGLETAFALSVTELVEGGYLTPMQLIDRMSRRPAEIGRVPGGSLAVGMPADVVVFDMDEWYEVDVDGFASKGRNTPFAGAKVKGRIEMTLVDGEVVYSRKG